MKQERNEYYFSKCKKSYKNDPTGEDRNKNIHIGTIDSTYCEKEIDSSWYNEGDVSDGKFKITCEKCLRIYNGDRKMQRNKIRNKEMLNG